MREQIASAEDVSKPELASQRSESVSRLPIPRSPPRLPCNLDNEIIIRITRETTHAQFRAPSIARADLPLKTVSRHLILKVDITDRGSDIVTMQSLVRNPVLKSNLGTSEDGFHWQLIPVGRGGTLSVMTADDSPDIVLVSVWIKGNLLLCYDSALQSREDCPTCVETRRDTHERENEGSRLAYGHVGSTRGTRNLHLSTSDQALTKDNDLPAYVSSIP